MTQSLRALNRPFSNFYGLLCRQQQNAVFSRTASNSCFLCSSAQTHLPLATSLIHQSQKLGTIVPRISTFRNFSSSSPIKYSAAPDSDETKIYIGGLTNQVKGLKLFTLTTSIAGLGAQPLIWTKFIETYGAGLAYAMLSYVGFFTLVTPLLIHYIAQKYVVELHFNEKTKTYRAVTFSLFLQRVNTVFKQEEVDKPDMLGMFETFRVRGKSLFVDPSLFEDSDFIKLMGYDKPMDFTYHDEDDKSKK